MRRPRFTRLWQSRRVIALALVVATSPFAYSQAASSPNYQFEGGSFASLGGGTCSTYRFAFTSVGNISGSGFSSLNFQAGTGFLEAFDPDLPTGLVVFGVSPKFGSTAGGTIVTVSGFNFDQFGAGPGTLVSVGGTPALNVVVASNTTLSFVTPPGSSGPRSIVISNTAGTTVVGSGFIYAPAVTSTPILAMGSNLAIDNYGAPGDNYLTFVSTAQSVIPAPPYGTLLVGPFPLIQLLPVLPYGPTGHAQVLLPVPVNPLFAGLSVHFQSVSLFASGGPPPGKLTNASTTGIQ